MILAIGLLVGATGCDRSSNESESAATSQDRSTSSPAPQRADRPTPDPSESEPAESDGASPDTPDRLWLGRYSEHSGRILVDLDELGTDHPIANQTDAFDSKGDAPFNSDLLAEPYRDLEKVDILTADGPVTLAVETFTRDAVGPSDFVIRLLTETDDSLADRLEAWTLVAPAGEMADEATFEPADGEPTHAKAVPKIRDAVMGQLSADQRDKFRHAFPPKDIAPEQREKLEAGNSLADVLDIDRTLESDHMLSVRGDFPSPRARFVAVNGPTGTGGIQGQEFPIVRALLFTTDTGEVTDTIDVMFGPNHAHGHAATARAETLAIADPDADGTQGVLYRADNSVGWVDFADGTPVHP